MDGIGELEEILLDSTASTAESDFGGSQTSRILLKLFDYSEALISSSCPYEKKLRF